VQSASTIRVAPRRRPAAISSSTTRRRINHHLDPTLQKGRLKSAVRNQLRRASHQPNIPVYGRTRLESTLQLQPSRCGAMLIVSGPASGRGFLRSLSLRDGKTSVGSSSRFHARHPRSERLLAELHESTDSECPHDPGLAPPTSPTRPAVKARRDGAAVGDHESDQLRFRVVRLSVPLCRPERSYARSAATRVGRAGPVIAVAHEMAHSNLQPFHTRSRSAEGVSSPLHSLLVLERFAKRRVHRPPIVYTRAGPDGNTVFSKEAARRVILPRSMRFNIARTERDAFGRAFGTAESTLVTFPLRSRQDRYYDRKCDACFVLFSRRLNDTAVPGW